MIPYSPEKIEEIVRDETERQYREELERTLRQNMIAVRNGYWRADTVKAPFLFPGMPYSYAYEFKDSAQLYPMETLDHAGNVNNLLFMEEKL
ncbi:MAG: hypothetical protein IJC98_04280 [Clostridia bacterium]|nr:hypothetical protein [Clostridia bacterium]